MGGTRRIGVVEDPRYRPLVIRALDALTLEPDGFINDRHAYLGLRSAYYRLVGDRSRAGLKSVVDQLWHVALRLEDGGGLTDAERRLRDIQDRLSKALEEGASDEEIRRLMQELRQALAEFMQQLARQAETQQLQIPEGLNPNQILRPQDLDRYSGPPRLLRATGATVTRLGGCCGMAGNFGMEKGHYEVSVAVAEHALLPAVRAAGPDAVVLADGFSCRTQLDDLADVQALHLAQLLSRR